MKPIEVTDLKTLKANKKMRVVVDKTPILLIYDDEKIYAIQDKCPHLGASLEKGTYENGAITCKAHHAKIDVKTGEIIEKAKMLFLKMPVKHAQTYKAEVKDDKIFLTM